MVLVSLALGARLRQTVPARFPPFVQDWVGFLQPKLSHVKPYFVVELAIIRRLFAVVLFYEVYFRVLADGFSGLTQASLDRERHT